MNLAQIIRSSCGVRRSLTLVELILLAIGVAGSISIVMLAVVPQAKSQAQCGSADSSDSATDEDCIAPRPPSRLQPTFSEEDERGLQERSLADSFLGDALRGAADPLGNGGSIGGNLETDTTIDELEPGDRGLTLEPGFDPTDVIIPLDAVGKSWMGRAMVEKQP